MNLFDLAAKITLDTSKYEAGIKKAGTAMKSAAVTIESYGEKIISVGDKAAKTFAAIETGIGTAVGTMIKSSVEGFGDFEQFVGGVETLFKDSSDTVIENASTAYKRAGLSANEYMETVTNFSASLLQSLGGDTVAAAEYADMAITDMSDNANKMGSDIETLKTAYSGFAKQNYTMLDNLKLGYGGTKSEMKRLIKDAEAISGKDLNIKNYSDIIEAIHIIQDNMGITGTTAREAASTIAGSMASAKMAAQNFFVGLADGNQDIDLLFDNLIESVGVAADNIAPRIITSLDRIGEVAEERSDDIAGFIGGLATQAAAQAPNFLRVTSSILNQIIKNIDGNKEEITEAGLEFFGNLIDSFEETLDLALPIIETLAPAVATGIMRGGTTLFKAGASVIVAVINGIASESDELADTAIDSILTIIGTVDDNLDKFLAAGEKIVVSIGNALSENGEEIREGALGIIQKLAEFLTDSAPELLPAAVGMILGLAEGLTDPETLETLFEAAINLILALGEGLIDSSPILLESAFTIVSNLVQGLLGNSGKLIEAAWKLVEMLVFGLLTPETLGIILGGTLELIGAIISGLMSGSVEMIGAGENIIDFVKQGFESLNPFEWGGDLIDNFIGGMKAGWDRLKNAVTETAQKIKDRLGFSEPKEGPLSNFHTYAPDMIDLFVKGIRDNEKKLTDQIDKSFDFGERTVDTVGHGDYFETVGEDRAIIRKSDSKDEERYTEININVDGASYDSDTELAEEIARVLEDLFKRKDD